MRLERTVRAVAGGAAVPVALGGLHALGGALGGVLAAPPADPAAWQAWVAEAGPGAAAMALVRLGALALGWVQVAALALAVAGRALRWHGGLVVAARLCLPVLRPVVGRVVGAGVVVALLPVPAGASGAPPAGGSGGTAARGGAGTATLWPLDPAPPAPPPPPASPDVSAPAAAPASPDVSAPPADAGGPDPAPTGDAWTVAPGEHFWSIAEAVVARRLGRAPTDAEVDPYWRRLVDTNRAVLVDPGNPDLLLPGQVLEVPGAAAPPSPRRTPRG